MSHRPGPVRIDRQPWGRLPSGEAVEHYTLSAASGLSFSVSTFGGTITRIRVPDRAGAIADVVMGFDDPAAYLSPAYRAAYPYFGSTIGRYANRISNARFTIDGVTHDLAANEARHHLHGGFGFDQRNWASALLPCGRGVRLTLVSPDGDQGYPGRLEAAADFLLEDEDEIVLRYEARTDRPTHVNLTSHSYFNLGGRGSGSALGHLVQIHADAFTPIDADALPTGAMLRVDGTPFDLRDPTPLADALSADHPQLRVGDGFNHNFVLRGGHGVPKPAARLVHSASGRALEIATTEPGVQFYSGNALDGRIIGPEGRPIGRRDALCFETQHFPDTPNIAGFPSTMLRPGEVYRSETRLRFRVF